MPIPQGMIYLHKSAFQSHGYLSSANCHVDSRWVLKISGFALHAFRKEDCKEQVGGFDSSQHRFLKKAFTNLLLDWVSVEINLDDMLKSETLN